VSAQATSFNIIINGENDSVDGTSCSSPTFAAMISLLNDIRLKNGKPTLGYLNPLIY